jgi:hypothetical protein
MAGMRPPHVPETPVPVFTGEELTRLERACAGRSFQQRRDAAIIAVLKATGSGCRSSPGSAVTPATSGAVTWTPERSPPVLFASPARSHSV